MNYFRPNVQRPPMYQPRLPFQGGGGITQVPPKPSDLAGILNLVAAYQQGKIGKKQREQKQVGLEAEIEKMQAQAEYYGRMPRGVTGKLVIRQDPTTKKWHTYLIDPTTGQITQDLGVAPPKQYLPAGIAGLLYDEELPDEEKPIGKKKPEIIPAGEEEFLPSLFEKIKRLVKPTELKPPIPTKTVPRKFPPPTEWLRTQEIPAMRKELAEAQKAKAKSPYKEYPDAFLENGVWKVIRNGKKYRIEK